MPLRDGVLTIGELARRAGVRPSTVRYYEAHRILPAADRLPSGYRLYTEDSVAVLRFIRRAQGYGMSLDEVKQLLTLVANGRRPCGRVREIAREHLVEISGRIKELELLRAQIRRMLRRTSRTAESDGTVCPIIEAGQADPIRPKAVRNRLVSLARRWPVAIIAVALAGALPMRLNRNR